MADYNDYDSQDPLHDAGDVQAYTVPNIIKSDASSPVNAELLGRSFEIKKQLLQSLKGTPGGILKPQLRRNSTFCPKSEDDDEVRSEEDKGNERKRRDQNNEWIQKLCEIVPELYTRAPPNLAKDAGQALKANGTKDGQPPKGWILSGAVEYIKDLQNQIDENNRKEVERVLHLKTLQLQDQGVSNVPISVGSTSAELALGEIGVGPHSEEYFKRVLRKALGIKN